MIGELVEWAAALQPGAADEQLARMALADTVAVTLAAADDPVVELTAGLPEPLRWAAVGHVLDFDDVHLPSTTHISVVCVNAALAAGGGARAYLAGAGTMARLGAALGWQHYRSGWHATCTAGAPAAAVAAGVALGLDAEGLRRAVALAVPAAGGVSRAFGTMGKCLQVGFATEAGVRAARLAAAGASADPSALEQWFALVGGTGHIDTSGPAVPGGLAVKLHPCCYAMQRPIGAARVLLADVPDPGAVARVTVTTPQAAVQPLIHPRPRTGLEAKFSLEYAIATALVDRFPGLPHFTDAAVARAPVRRLVERTEVRTVPDGEDLLAGETHLLVELADGSRLESALDLPWGHPGRPADRADLAAKVAACVGEDRAEEVAGLSWDGAARLLRKAFPGRDGCVPRAVRGRAYRTAPATSPLT